MPGCPRASPWGILGAAAQSLVSSLHEMAEAEVPSQGCLKVRGATLGPCWGLWAVGGFNRLAQDRCRLREQVGRKGRWRGNQTRTHERSPWALSNTHLLFFGPVSRVFYGNIRGDLPSSRELSPRNVVSYECTRHRLHACGQAAGFLVFTARRAAPLCGLPLPAGLRVSPAPPAGETPRGWAGPSQEVCSPLPGVPAPLRFHPSLGVW